jgi:C1A family cysteine protease
MIGVKVYKGMVSDECKRTGIVPDPSCFDTFKVLGGHALCAVGFNDNSPYFKDGHIKCKNSWGVDFGDKGYIYLSYKNISSNMIDAFSCIDIEDDKPYKILTVKDTGRGPWV